MSRGASQHLRQIHKQQQNTIQKQKQQQGWAQQQAWHAKDKEGVQKILCFLFSGTNFLNVRNTTLIWGNWKIPWRREWRSPQNGFVERILTQQHCAHRLRKQAWVLNPGKEGNIPRPGSEKKDEKYTKGGRGANDCDETCSKNCDTKKKINSSSLGISTPLKSGQIERWYFDRRAR